MAGEPDDGDPELEPAEYLRRLFVDVEFSYLVVVAARLGVADLLAAGPRSIADLASATGVDTTSLYRVLRAWLVEGCSWTRVITGSH